MLKLSFRIQMKLCSISVMTTRVVFYDIL